MKDGGKRRIIYNISKIHGGMTDTVFFLAVRERVKSRQESKRGS